MNKKELYKAVAEKANTSQRAVKEIMETVQEVVFETMKTDEVKIFDGITIETAFQDAHTGRNPMTGESVDIDGKYRPRCKFGKAVKDMLNA